MQSIHAITGSLLLALSLSAGAHETTGPQGSSADTIRLDPLNIMQAAPCKASGDGTFAEMITTMASVLPPAEADAFLARYCVECNRRKFTLSLTR